MNQYQQNETVNFQQPTKNPKKKERKEEKRRERKRKGKGKENLSFIKGFLTENRNHVHQQKKITTPPFKNKQRKNLKQLYIVTWQCFNPRVLR